ncbi:MAG: hypothetical protein U1F87_15365 [Kiritimatiellia bacterium]
MNRKTLFAGLALLALTGCGGRDAGESAVDYSIYQGAEMARLALALNPAPARVLLLGYNTPTGNEFLSGVMKSCAEELAVRKVPVATALVEADLMALQTGRSGIAPADVEKALRTYPGSDTVISFAGLPQAASVADGPRWVVLSSDPLAARQAVESGRVRIAVFPRMGPPVAGSREKAADRFAAEYEVLRAP